jgi:hypothetical protein
MVLKAQYTLRRRRRTRRTRSIFISINTICLYFRGNILYDYMIDNRRCAVGKRFHFGVGIQTKRGLGLFAGLSSSQGSQAAAPRPSRGTDQLSFTRRQNVVFRLSIGRRGTRHCATNV